MQNFPVFTHAESKKWEFSPWEILRGIPVKKKLNDLSFYLNKTTQPFQN
jgi:hypothetical protein